MANDKKEKQLDYIEINSRINSRFKYKDLVYTNNLKSIFDNIRNHLAGNAKHMTRDETLAKELINILFCKIYDEETKQANDRVDFYALYKEEAKDVKKRIVSYFEKEVKKNYKDILHDSKITLDDNSLYYIVYNLQKYNIKKVERDAIGDAFETFFGPTLRGSEGQFFTPKNVTQLIIDILDPGPNDIIIDPACGSGGFLVMSLYYIHKRLTRKIRNDKKISKRYKNIASNNIYGIDKDNFLTKITRIYMSLIDDGKSGIFCEDSLAKPKDWDIETRRKVKLSHFDLLMTNPPFGAKIPIRGYEKLEQYNLGHKWKRDKKNKKWLMKNKVLSKQTPQILFIERCIQLLKNRGRMGIILPEGLFGNPSDRYIWEYLFKNTKILAIISLPQETFQPSTHTKTSILILEKTKVNSSYNIFMAIAKKVGHDKNGKPIYKMKNDGSLILDKNNNKIIDDDLPSISKNYKKTNKKRYSHLGFYISSSKVKKDFILIPEYYNPEIEEQLKKLEQSNKYILVSIGKLISKGFLKITRGNEIGSKFYGTGEIPFVRTTDIVNWEIKSNPIKCVSEELYEYYKDRQDIRPGDILFVSDGTFLIGRVAMVTDLDKKIIIQSHLKKIRVKDNPLLNPYLLFYVLNTKIVQEQIKSKTFIQATISSLGNRIKEIILPIPKDKIRREELSKEIEDIIKKKVSIRKKCLNLPRL